jgi:hypothetical protein
MRPQRPRVQSPVPRDPGRTRAGLAT